MKWQKGRALFFVLFPFVPVDIYTRSGPVTDSFNVSNEDQNEHFGVVVFVNYQFSYQCDFVFQRRHGLAHLI